MRYRFEDVTSCEMCGDSSNAHRVLGQRLSKSQGLNPRQETGVSVSVKQCRNCSLIYAVPLPIPFDIQDHYGTPPEDYWSEDYFKTNPEQFAKPISIAKELLSSSKKLAALDIGAGLGKNVIALKNAGFDAYGIEASEPFHSRAISKMGVSPANLKLGMIEDATYPESSFDFITFGAVLEHLYHPAYCVEKAMQWLKPNGVLHVGVPSSKHLIGRLVNTYYRIRGCSNVTNISPMHAPFHLYEFGLESFKELGKRLGFEISKYHYDVCSIMMVPKILHPSLRKYMEWTDTGMQLSVYMRKLEPK